MRSLHWLLHGGRDKTEVRRRTVCGRRGGGGAGVILIPTPEVSWPRDWYATSSPDQGAAADGRVGDGRCRDCGGWG